jgi:hypothetical protein
MSLIVSVAALLLVILTVVLIGIAPLYAMHYLQNNKDDIM